MSTGEGAPIDRLVGVYDADGGLIGELSYLVGRRRGTAHCALCDLTHGRLRRRAEWVELVSDLGVPFDLVHRNERSPEVVAASSGRTPCVLASSDGDLVVLLGPDELEATSADLAAFRGALEAAATRAGLRWPTRVSPSAGEG